MGDGEVGELLGLFVISAVIYTIAYFSDKEFSKKNPYNRYPILDDDGEEKRRAMKLNRSKNKKTKVSVGKHSKKNNQPVESNDEVNSVDDAPVGRIKVKDNQRGDIPLSEVYKTLYNEPKENRAKDIKMKLPEVKKNNS